MERTADPQTQLITDEAILDYLIYVAIKALLSSSETIQSSEHSAYLPLQMVGSFLPMFRALHPNHNTPVETSFRLRLLQFACPRQSEYEDHGKGLSSRSSIEGPRQDLALQASLPSFLALSAVQNALQESTITELWMRLAAGYMAQAYAEQVLEYHNSRSDLLGNTFRWSFDHECVAEEGSDEWLINEMFDADANVINLWEKIKNEHIRAVSYPPPGDAFADGH
ncbi:MAG: hypothetical protein LQ341_001407 [Variospora aurantia]|nr:MAG: hypothetical protein LQ341_001407 [Variospora aurantia]